MAKDILVRIVGDASGFGKEVDGVERKLGGFSGNIGKIAGAVGGAFAAAKVGDFLKGAVEAAAESARVAAQTDAALKSTGGAAGVTAEQIGSLAHQLQGLSGVQDETIQTGQNMLLTFTGIKNQVGAGNDIFDQASRTMLDMSVAMGTDAKSSALQLGKALNDPAKGLSALTRVGVTFTDAQKAQIKAMTDAGDKAGAQKVILAELNKEFGGSAKAAGEAQTPMQKLGLAFGDLQETIGTKLLPVVEKIATFFAEHQALIIPLAAAIGGVLVAAFAAWAISAATAAVATLAAAAPIIAIGAAIALLVAGVVLLVTHWDEVWGKVKEIAGKAWEAIKGGIDAAIGWFKELPGKILGALGDFANLLVDAGGKVVSGLWSGIKEAWDREVKFWTELPGRILGLLGDVGSWLLDAGGKVISGLWSGIKNIWRDTLEPFFYNLKTKVLELLGDVGTWLWDAGKKIVGGLWGGIKEVWEREVVFWTETVPGVFLGIVNFIKELPPKIAAAATGMWDGIKNAFKSAINFIIRGWNALEFKIPGFNVGPAHFGGFTLGVPNIPELAKGGIVTGPTLALIGERGPEAVIPLGPGGLGGVFDKTDKASAGVVNHFHLTVVERDRVDLQAEYRRMMLVAGAA